MTILINNSEKCKSCCTHLHHQHCYFSYMVMVMFKMTNMDIHDLRLVKMGDECRESDGGLGLASKTL